MYYSLSNFYLYRQSIENIDKSKKLFKKEKTAEELTLTATYRLIVILNLNVQVTVFS